MIRSVSGDHIMFQECIEVFRPSQPHPFGDNKVVKTEKIIIDFYLPYELNFNNIKIGPTVQVNFTSGPYSSFVAPITFEDYEHNHNSHLFAIALSSIISFISSRRAKGPRDSYTTHFGNEALALHLPIKIAGTGSTYTSLSEDKIKEIELELKEIIDILYKLPYENYQRIMQSIRLVNLAHNTKREDFSLSYYLLVSAMENVAQMAIPKELKKDPDEERWEELAKEHKEIKNLLNQYKNYQKNSHQLIKRFTNFILTYCPVSHWSKLGSQYSEIELYKGLDWLEEKKWDEKYPEDFKAKQLKTIIQDTYNYRSKFTHEGKAPPHTSPDSYNRFFDTVQIYDENGVEETNLMNYRLLSFITRNSILEYIKIFNKQLQI